MAGPSLTLFVPQQPIEENLVVNLFPPFSVGLAVRYARRYNFYMKLPNAARAIVEIEKLSDYCLSESHSRGKHKARVFAATLGLTAKDAPELQEALLEAARVEEALVGEYDEYGQRYLVGFSMKRRGREAVIRSVWIIRTGKTRRA